VEHARRMLEQIGLEGQRLQMINVSAAMAGEFTFAAAEITSEIKGLGPNPLRKPRKNGRDRKADTGDMERERIKTDDDRHE
jgi:hypothetical protein